MKLGALCMAMCACAGPDVTPPAIPTSPLPPPDAELASVLVDDAAQEVEDVELPPPDDAAVVDAPPSVGEVWLKGSTHVHAKASGDSSEPNANVVAWYEKRHYDFIVLTDHNRVSELAKTSETRGQITLRDPKQGMIVFAGIELTHNPVGCLPQGDKSRKCRIHVNLLGATARPGGKLEWAERRSHERIDMYQAALVAQKTLGGVAQINHPQWFWGMSPELLVELSHRGVRLIEIANSAFAKWNKGDADHASMEDLWDAALQRGAALWGLASDDAHDYTGHGKYPAGGGWVVVHARRDPQAILDALMAGRFYASNGVVLEHAEADAGELVVTVGAAQTGNYTIEFIENGKRVDSVKGKSARRAVPATGYLRAVVIRDDGTRAWVQPVRP